MNWDMCCGVTTLFAYIAWYKHDNWPIIERVKQLILYIVIQALIAKRYIAHALLCTRFPVKISRDTTWEEIYVLVSVKRNTNKYLDTFYEKTFFSF